jgi:hypothetical protein
MTIFIKYESCIQYNCYLLVMRLISFLSCLSCFVQTNIIRFTFEVVIKVHFFPHILHPHNFLRLYHENFYFYKGHSEIRDMSGSYKRVYLHNYIVSICYQSLRVYHKVHFQLLTSYTSAAPQRFHKFQLHHKY